MAEFSTLHTAVFSVQPGDDPTVGDMKCRNKRHTPARYPIAGGVPLDGAGT